MLNIKKWTLSLSNLLSNSLKSNWSSSIRPLGEKLYMVCILALSSGEQVSHFRSQKNLSSFWEFTESFFRVDSRIYIQGFLVKIKNRIEFLNKPEKSLHLNKSASVREWSNKKALRKGCIACEQNLSNLVPIWKSDSIFGTI